MGKSYIYKNQKKLRWGYTTGTCAAAASLAAAVVLLRRESVEQVQIETPKGILLDLEIEDMKAERDWVSCAVRKDGGDDPDVTNGFLVYSRVSRENPFKDKWETRKSGCYEYKNSTLHLFLSGGMGIGRVTKEGLSCEVGKYAINPVPRQMIFFQVEKVCRQEGFQGSLWIEISVPEGVEAASRTFNGKLGIEGGISILGTSGMVEPMSETALLETIRLELRQKALEGQSQVILTPGNYGQQFIKKAMGLELEQAVKCSNFIGATIDMAVEEGVKGLLLIGHGGKLIKVAAGVMNTHSSVADGRMEVLAAYAGAWGCKKELVRRLLSSVTVEDALRQMDAVEGLLEGVMRQVTEAVDRHLKGRAGGRIAIETVIFTNERGILGMSCGATGMLKKLRCEKPYAGMGRISPVGNRF